MKLITFVFTRSKKVFPIVSWIICLLTRRKYSHVALEINIDNLSKPMYFQSNESKVNYEYSDYFLKENEIIKKYELYVKEDLYNDLAKQRLMSVGENYGHLQNLGILFVDLLKFIKVDINNPWKKGKNCSELIYTCILKNIEPKLNYNANTIKPNEIEDILVNYLKLQEKE